MITGMVCTRYSRLIHRQAVHVVYARSGSLYLRYSLNITYLRGLRSLCKRSRSSRRYAKHAPESAGRLGIMALS